MTSKVRNRMVYLSVAAGVTVLAGIGWRLTSRSSYESAGYTVLESSGDFEMREYEDLMLASTSTQFEANGRDGSFMRLFGYISGENQDSRQIAMTIPVFMEPVREGGGGRMAFVLPQAVAAAGPPQPSTTDVELQPLAAGRFATVRFSGQMNPRTLADAEQKLRGWLQQRGISTEEPAIFAGYDPPWTPGPLRRNEVLIRLN